MTLEKQKLALAKLLPEMIGTHIGNDCSTDVIVLSLRWRVGSRLGDRITSREWLYVVHECEKKLTPAQQYDYSGALYGLLNRKDMYWPEISNEGFLHCHATFEQRAEALLKTLGLWEE